MTENEQIQEMAKVLESACENMDCTKPINCDLCQAKQLYSKNYRKIEWISVDERLPEEKGDYLVYTERGKMMIMPFFTERNSSSAVYDRGFCIFEKGRRTNDDDWWKPVQYVTHWMPLPEPPSEADMRGETK